MQTLASPTARGAKCPEVIEKKGWLPAPEKGLATGFGLRLGALIPLIPPTPQNTVGKVLEIAIDSKQIKWAYDSYLDILKRCDT